jgi:hypothetical protein
MNITARRVATQVQLDNESLDYLHQVQKLGEERLQEIINREIIERFINEMLSTRLQDLKTEEVIGPDGKSKLETKLELFVFNKEELKGLISAIKNGVEIM